MQFTLRIDMDGEAFAKVPLCQLSWILRQLGDGWAGVHGKIAKKNWKSIPVHDCNGNHVGHATIT